MADTMQGLRRTCLCGEVTLEMGEVVVGGFTQRVRDKGSLIFIDLRDKSGIVQLVFDETTDKSVFEKAESVRSEYVLLAKGTVRARESVNTEIKTGGVEIMVTELRILSKAQTPPFEIVSNTKTNEELRLKYRYLDLRREPLQKNLIMRHEIAKAAREYFYANGFTEIETPMMIKSTPEGARDYIVPSRIHNGKFYALPQSPQMYKQLLMIAGMDRYIQLARCFRDEDLRADRQPEFTQIDCEMSFVEQEDILEVFERWAKHMFKHVLGIELTEPLRELYVMAYSLPSIAAYLYKSTTKRLQVIFGSYLPEAQPKDFYEMEIASGSIMRGFMSVPCDVYFTMEAKVSRFLDCSLKLYDVPKEKRAAITAAVLQLDLHTMAASIIQKTVQQAEKGFEALTEK